MEEAAAVLRDGGIVAYPTETVYGLAVDPFSVEALDRLFAAKGRAREKAILLIIGCRAHLDRVAADVPPRAQAYMDAFWPGPLSLLLPKHPDLPEELAPGLDSICVRCPGLPAARALCDAFGGPVTSTSANTSGEAPARSLDDLDLPGLTLGLDGGLLRPEPPSTILDVRSGKILREGPITAAQIAAL